MRLFSLASDRDLEGQRALIPPIADEELAGPDRDGHLGPEGIVPLLDVGAARFLAGGEAEKFPAQRREGLAVGQLILGVDRGINGSVSAPAQISLFSPGHDIDDVEFGPFCFAGAQLVTDHVNQTGKERDIDGKRDPGEHLFPNSLEPDPIERADHHQIADQEQEEPAHGQLTHLLAVDHRPEDPVGAVASRGTLGRGMRKQRGRQPHDPGPEMRAVFPGEEWFQLRAE